MNEQEKTLQLAKLMPEWEVGGSVDYPHISSPGTVFHLRTFRPYDVKTGLAQFAAILLKFPSVMWEGKNIPPTGEYANMWEWAEEGGEPTQKNILDEILRMNGIKA